MNLNSSGEKGWIGSGEDAYIRRLWQEKSYVCLLGEGGVAKEMSKELAGNICIWMTRRP